MKSFHAQLSRSRPSSRLLSSTSQYHITPRFTSGPTPPRLPEDEQKRYEDLQRSSNGAFSTPNPTVVINQSPPKPLLNQSPNINQEILSNDDKELAAMNARVQATGDGEELHPDVRRGVQPEFEGERNPKTGEIGGPKNEPLRWGGGVDWSYNGRVTDF